MFDNKGEILDFKVKNFIKSRLIIFFYKSGYIIYD